MDVHVLPAGMGLGEAHDVTRRVEAAAGGLFPRTHVVAHMDPDTVVAPRDGR